MKATSSAAASSPTSVGGTRRARNGPARSNSSKAPSGSPTIGQHRVRYARALLELGETERARPVVERLLRNAAGSPNCWRSGSPVAEITEVR